MKHAQRSQRGVSLLEALIAVALLAGLTMLLAPTLLSSMRASSEVLSRAAARESDRIVDEALRQIFQNAVIMDNSDSSLRVGGNEKSLHVVSLAGSSQARRFNLRIKNGALIGRISHLSEGSGLSQETRLLESGAVRFAYYGRTTPNAPLSWSTSWNSALQPRIVRLEAVSDKNADNKAYHDVYIAAHGPLHCAFDTVSRRCRS